jgi:hypothetical protein
LCDPARREPLIARIFIATLEREVGLEGDLVRECRLAVRERHVPLDVELRAVDDRLQLEADARGSEVINSRPVDRAGQRGGLRDALHRELAVDLDVVAIPADLLRDESQLGEALRVEELLRAAPVSAPSTSETLKSVISPPNAATAYGTSNERLECTVSAFHVPAGTAV